MEKDHDSDPQERSTWRSGARSAMSAASQLPGSRVPTSSGNHGKHGKSHKKIPCMKKPE